MLCLANNGRKEGRIITLICDLIINGFLKHISSIFTGTTRIRMISAKQIAILVIFLSNAFTFYLTFTVGNNGSVNIDSSYVSSSGESVDTGSTQGVSLLSMGSSFQKLKVRPSSLDFANVFNFLLSDTTASISVCSLSFVRSFLKFL
jgi:hypothetical protein